MRLRMTLRNAAMFASPKGVPTYQALALFCDRTNKTWTTTDQFLCRSCELNR
jgi:hypothetical protein